MGVGGSCFSHKELNIKNILENIVMNTIKDKTICSMMITIIGIVQGK